jgi:predicted RNA binding protein YcfA (HicA-like mRNA interferase family)
MPIRYNSRELIELLEADGWVCVGIRGSHHKYKHPTKLGIVVVPHPKKDMSVGTSMKILKDAGLK